MAARRYASCSPSKEKHTSMFFEPPTSFLCPITMDTMRDPVVLRQTGHTFERCAIEEHLRRFQRCPYTQCTLIDNGFLPNHTLRKAIEEFQEEFEGRRAVLEGAAASLVTHYLKCARMYHELGKDDQAIQRFQEIVELSEVIYGKRGTNTAVMVMFLAEAICERDGCTAVVERLCDRALSIQENAYGKNHDLVVRMIKQRDCLKAKGIQVSVPELPLHDGNQAPVAMQEPQSHTPASVSAGSSALREPRTLAVTPVRLSHAIDEPHFANDFALDSAVSLRKLSAQFMAENKYDRALAKAEEALAILESSFPTKHVEFARIYRAIGEAMFSQGRLQESLSKYTTSLAYIAKESNDDRLEEATINLHIGRALKEMGSYNDALVSMDTAMNMQIEELGLRSLEVAHTIDEMSLVLNKLYRFDEAIHCISRSVYIKSLHFSTEMNASYATSLDHLGLIAREQGKYQDALAHHARALQIRKEVLGVKHLDTAATYQHLGVLAFLMGDYTDSLTKLEQALGPHEAVFGRSHPRVASILVEMANTCTRTKRLEQAFGYAEEALATTLKFFQALHPETGRAMHCMACVLHWQGHLAEALTMYGQALSVKGSILGHENKDVADTCYNLALLLRKSERHTEATEMFRHCCHVYRSVLGAAHPETLDAARQLTLSDLDRQSMRFV